MEKIPSEEMPLGDDFSVIIVCNSKRLTFKTSVGYIDAYQDISGEKNVWVSYLHNGIRNCYKIPLEEVNPDSIPGVEIGGTYVELEKKDTNEKEKELNKMRTEQQQLKDKIHANELKLLRQEMEIRENSRVIESNNELEIKIAESRNVYEKLRIDITVLSNVFDDILLEHKILTKSVEKLKMLYLVLQDELFIEIMPTIIECKSDETIFLHSMFTFLNDYLLEYRGMKHDFLIKELTEKNNQLI